MPIRPVNEKGERREKGNAKHGNFKDKEKKRKRYSHTNNKIDTTEIETEGNRKIHSHCEEMRHRGFMVEA